MHPRNPHCPTMHFNYRYFVSLLPDHLPAADAAAGNRRRQLVVRRRTGHHSQLPGAGGHEALSQHSQECLRQARQGFLSQVSTTRGSMLKPCPILFAEDMLSSTLSTTAEPSSALRL
eukprot:756711-Hanusia_phi.AAC.1